MTGADLAQLRSLVATVGERIQPLLLPCETLAHRNAFAHIWLGVKTRFGDNWRETADSGEVGAFVRWMDAHPNEEYGAFAGSVTARELPTLFNQSPDADA